jgi:hypothetical protein
MAMKDDSLDEWVALYRQSAREQSAPSVDARILAAAEQASQRRRWPAWPIGLATAAALLLMFAMHPGTSDPRGNAAHATPSIGRNDDTASYLMQMDVTHPDSPVAQYLLSPHSQTH